MARKRAPLCKVVASTALLALLGVGSASADIDVAIDFAPGSSAADLQVPNNQFTVRISATGSDLGTDPLIGYDLRLDYDPAQLDVAGASMAAGPNTAFPIAPTVTKEPGVELPESMPAGYHRHVSAADLAGTITQTITPVPSAYDFVDLTFQTSASPTGTIGIVVSKNNRAPKPINPVLVMGDMADDSVVDDVEADRGITVNYTSLLGLSGMADLDGDGVADSVATEVLANDPGASNTSGYLADSDGDGLSDAEELNYDLSLANAWNYAYDAGTDTNPRDNDTDNDGWIDGLEVRYPAVFPNGPLVADVGLTDVDGDGVPAAIDPNDGTNDSDSDGYHDAYELAQGYAANDSNDFPPLGEISGSAPVNNTDGFILFNYAVGNIPFVNVQNTIMNGDLNGDGRINNTDGFILYNWAVGNIPVMPTNLP